MAHLQAGDLDAAEPLQPARRKSFTLPTRRRVCFRF